MRNLILNLIKKPNDLGIKLNPPATDKEIEAFKQIIKQDIPLEIIEFYKICNGFETNDMLFRFIPLQEIIEQKKEVEKDSFPIAEYLIYSDTWDVNLTNQQEYTITNTNHGTEPSIVVTNSIFKFMQLYIGCGGLFGDDGLYERMEKIKTRSL